jgi:hypothetical protein
LRHSPPPNVLVIMRECRNGGGSDGNGGGNLDNAFAIFNGDGTQLLGSAALPGIQGTQPDLSRDDAHLVFVVPAAGSIALEGDHHFSGGSLYSATFDASTNTIGTPTQILAAGGRSYYYPSISPDGTFLVFNDAPQPGNTATSNNDVFYNRQARVKVMHYPPAPGATPQDLPALNVADGLTNSWPRWSPFVTTYKGKKLLWVTFSSNRDYGLHLVNKGFDNYYPNRSPAVDQPQPLDKNNVTFDKYAAPQIWMAAVVVDPDPSYDSKDRSYPAFWLPFQDVNSHNHSAQWVEKVVGGSPDAGTCGEKGAACGSTPCCADVVCCNGVCDVTCVN